MKVYIVIGRKNYESYDIIHIFNSLQPALNYKKELRENPHNYEKYYSFDVEEWDVEDIIKL